MTFCLVICPWGCQHSFLLRGCLLSIILCDVVGLFVIFCGGILLRGCLLSIILCDVVGLVVIFCGGISVFSVVRW